MMTPARDEYLDAIRGIAAAVVVVAHLVAGFYPAAAPQVWHNGEFAVQVFFVLSGFVLSLSYVRTGSLESLRSAAARRYFRLAVPVAASVLLSYLLLASGLYFNTEAAQLSGQPPDSWLARWFNFAPSLPRALDEGLVRTFFAHDETRTYNNVLWTMQVEFLGSFFVFGFLALFGRLRNRPLLYLALLAVCVRLNWACGSAFVAGVALCDLCGGQARSRNVLGLVLVIAGVVIGGTTPPAWLPTRLAAFHAPAGATLLIAGAVWSGWARRLLSPFVFLGKLSFPLYLGHVLVELSLGCYVYISCRSGGLDHATAFLWAAAATITVSLLLAWLGSLTVEPWSIALGRYAYKRAFR